jgi:hypothetical protein
LFENIKKRESTESSSDSSDSSGSSSDKVDEDGNTITSETPPWKLRAKWNFQPIEVVVPFTKAYGFGPSND